MLSHRAAAGLREAFLEYATAAGIELAPDDVEALSLDELGIDSLELVDIASRLLGEAGENAVRVDVAGVATVGEFLARVASHA